MSPGPGATVVTGAARGFGLEIARRLYARGHSVVLGDVDGDAVRSAAASLGPRAVGLVADVRDPAGHALMASRAAELGDLKVWVNNAGIAIPAKVWDHADADVRATVEVNVLGVMNGSRAAVASMKGNGGGQILNIASLAALGPAPGLAIYAATKSAVLSFTLGLQADLQVAGLPIRVHVLCPDASDTRMVRDVVLEPDAAILFSGGGLLDPGKVADSAVGMLDGRRLVRTVPAWRGAVARSSALTPSVGLRALRIMRWAGDRRRPD